MKDTFGLVKKVREAPVSPGTLLLKIDIKDFYMSGDQDKILKIAWVGYLRNLFPRSDVVSVFV